jgi:hypothetical protein
MNHVFVGCHGYAAHLIVTWGPEPTRPEQIQIKQQQSIRGFDYDPVQTEPFCRHPYVFFRHGHGRGLAAFNTETQTLVHCRVTGGDGPIRDVRPGSDRSLLVQVADAWVRWNLNGATEPLCSGEFELLRETKTGIWAMPRSDATRVLFCRRSTR